MSPFITISLPIKGSERIPALFKLYLYTFNKSSNSSDVDCCTSSNNSVYAWRPVNDAHLELILVHNFLRNLFPSSDVAHAASCVNASCIYPSVLNASISWSVYSCCSVALSSI